MASASSQPSSTEARRELRRDPLSGRWTVIAPGRARRPGAGRTPGGEPAGTEPADCPFCEGHEDRTPPETFVIAPPGRAANTAGWQVRVVPNLFPALAPTQHPWHREGLLEAREANGVVEVVVNTPRHVRSIADLNGDELSNVAATWSARALAAREAGFPYLHAMVNEGRDAGASLAHSHSQLAWLGGEPPAVGEERRQTEEAGGCVLCRLLEVERETGARTVAEADGVVCLAAFAGRQPYELLLAPSRCERDPFTSDALAGALRLAAAALRSIHAIEGRIAANLWVHGGGHWHVELLPRTSVQAGLELGAGIHVNTLAPEEAAARLRAR